MYSYEMMSGASRRCFESQAKAKGDALEQRSSGWVYVMSNPAMPSLVKVGLTRRGVAQRQKGLSGEGVPKDYQVQFALEVEARRVFEIETRAHELLARWADGKEFFAIDARLASQACLLAAAGASIFSTLDPHGFLGRHARDPSGFSREVARVRLAAQAEDFEAVERAVEAGFDPWAFAGEEGSLASQAAQAWSEELLKALLLPGAPVPLAQGAELLERACACGWLEGARALIDAGARSGSSGLARACAWALCDADMERAAPLLVQAGADPNGRDRDGATALMWAASKGMIGLAMALADLGARVRDRAPQTHPLWPGCDAMWISLKSGSLAMTRWLLDQGADPNATDGAGRLAMGEALRGPQGFATARYLIDAGADLGASDPTGESFFSELIGQGLLEGERLCLARMGLESGASLDAGSENLWPLRRAMEREDARAFDFLLARGAAVDGSPWGRATLPRVAASLFAREREARVDFDSPCWDRRQEMALRACQASQGDPRSMADIKALARENPHGLFAYFLRRLSSLASSSG